MATTQGPETFIEARREAPLFVHWRWYLTGRRLTLHGIPNRLLVLSTLTLCFATAACAQTSATSVAVAYAKSFVTGTMRHSGPMIRYTACRLRPSNARFPKICGRRRSAPPRRSGKRGFSSRPYILHLDHATHSSGPKHSYEVNKLALYPRTRADHPPQGHTLSALPSFGSTNF